MSIESNRATNYVIYVILLFNSHQNLLGVGQLLQTYGCSLCFENETCVTYGKNDKIHAHAQINMENQNFPLRLCTKR